MFVPSVKQLIQWMFIAIIAALIQHHWESTSKDEIQIWLIAPTPKKPLNPIYKIIGPPASFKEYNNLQKQFVYFLANHFIRLHVYQI